MGSSFYLQLAPYILLEYTYGGPTTNFLSSQVKLSRIENKYTGEMQFLNGSAAQNVTQNVLDFSAANIGGYKWAFLNKDVPVPYISTDPKLVYTDMGGIFTSAYVMYDRVRLHLLSGYRLEDLQGLLAQVYVKEAQTDKVSVFANNVYLNSDDRDVLNPKPILLGDRMYDRYIEFMVPSLKEINKDFYSNPTNPISIGYQYSSNTRGFLFNSAIYVKVYEISTIEKKNGNLILNTDDSYEINVNQEDTYSLLSANIQEASDGDYFTYYPTYAGNFIEEFIVELNASGGDYIIMNDIDVYEQIGLENFLTYSFSQVQQGDFDQPLDFRPLIKYAESAVSFSIDYTVRIYNRENGYQIIRKASATSFHPKKYGKQIDKIALSEQSYPFKVYNKVYGGPTVTYANPENTTGGFNTVYVPVFYDSRNIVIQQKSVLAEGANPLDPNFGTDGIYMGQGDARIYIGDFDSYFKFSVFQVNSPPKKMNLSASTIELAFKDSAGQYIKIPALDSTADNSSADGEIVFRVPGYIKERVLGKTATSVKNFYLISSNPGSADTILYTGTVDTVDNVNKEQARLKQIASSVLTNASFAKTGTTASISTAASSTTEKGAIVKTGNNAPSLLQTLTNSNKEGINSIKQTKEVQPVDIPGFTFDPNAVSVKTGLKPVAVDPRNAAKTNVETSLSQKPGVETRITKSGPSS